jgi:hypothetical protein
MLSFGMSSTAGDAPVKKETSGCWALFVYPALLTCILVFAGCNESKAPTTSKAEAELPAAIVQFSVGGSVKGLEGTGLQLTLNGKHHLKVTSNGPYLFKEKVEQGSSFSVTVTTQPTNPTQLCTLEDESGKVTGDIAIEVFCETDTVDLPLLDLPRLAPSCFTGGSEPQLDFPGPVSDWTWNDPHVLKVGATYVMYASPTDFFQFPVRLYRLTSPNGVTWTLDPPVSADEGILADAEEGAWDAGGLETPAVVYFGDRYHLFYTSYRYPVGHTEHSALNYRIGHAVSDDGITFSRQSTAPVIQVSGDAITEDNAWYAYLVAEPGPVIFNGELYLYFTAFGIDFGLGTNLQVIGLIRSADGVTWTEPELALKPDQLLYPRSGDWIGYSTPNAIVLNDRMHLFFDVAHQPEGGDWKQLRLHHAASENGSSGWLHDATAIRHAGDFPWAVDEIRSPHALLDGDLLRLYFAGHKLDAAPYHFAVGMMTCDLGAR